MDNSNKYFSKVSGFILFFCLTLCSNTYAKSDEFFCTPFDKSLIDQSFSIDIRNKKVKMNDQRKIFDIIFSPLKIEFKKSLSIRNIDSLTSKKKEYFIYKFDKKSLNLDVSISSNLEKIFSYTCKLKN